MAEKAPSEEEAEGAGHSESFLDQFLRRLDHPSDHDTGDSPSTSGSMLLASSSSEYNSATNPWSFLAPSPVNPDLPTHGLLYPGASVAASPFAANPLAEFPWLPEFDPLRPGFDARLPGGTDPEAHDSAQRLYSSYAPHEQLLGSPSSSSQQSLFQQRDQMQLQALDEPASKREPSPVGHGSGSSSSKLDAGPVPRFGRVPSAEELRPGLSSAHLSGQAAHLGPINSRPPTSPLLSEATGAGAGGSVTTSAGTSNTSVSSGPSTSNAGDDEESGKKEGETSSRKRKKSDAAGGSGEEVATPGAAGDTPDSLKKSDPPKSKPRKRGGAKRLREPRYAIKTRTDVDVLDDGFKWRKYGQKAVKNSPHPRNYYRCTTPLCPVRKRVERSNEDSGLVITTYEGTHTHQTPGFHRPSAGGYFGDRALGMGGGLFPGPGGANLLPLPPGFDLASLQQANALRTFRGLQPNPSFQHQQQHHHQQQQQQHQQQQQQQQQQQHQQQLRQLGLQQESLFRAQQFLGLQDPASSFGSGVKQEPFQFGAQAPPESPFLPRLPHSQLGGSHSLSRSIPDLPLLRSGPLFSGLPAFPNLPPAGPASSSSHILPSSSREPARLDPVLPAGLSLGGSSPSSRIDQSLDTLVNSSAGRPNFEESSAGQPPPAAGRPLSGPPMNILGSGSLLDSRGLQPSARTPPLPPQQQQTHLQRSVRSGLGSSSSENLQGPAVESSSTLGQGQQQQQQQQAEGLLQDMVRPGGPKVSKS